jgi:hypothetical protein
VSKLTGASIQDVLNTNSQGKTFAEIAEDKGVGLEQYKEALLDTKLTYIDEQVNSGFLTEEQGKLAKKRIEQNIQNCDGQGFNHTQGYSRNNMGMGMGRGQRGNGFRFNNVNNL